MGQEETSRDRLPARRERPAAPAARLTHHLVEAERLEVRAGRGLDANALLDRIGLLNRTRFLPVIERVLDEFDRPGEMVRLDRLMLDLGRVDADRLGLAEARLETALRAALRSALSARERKANGSERARIVPESIALLDAFQHYLVHGAWPYGAGIDAQAAPDQCLSALLESEPLALVAMLRRHGSTSGLVRRLVLQIPEAGLQVLLRRLAPGQAAHVIACLDEIRESHAIEPVVPVAPPELDHMLWTIVLRDALSRAGLQANRKAFLRGLLGELSRAGGVELAALVAQLRRGIRDTGAWQNEGPSVIELLAEIAGEDDRLVGDALLILELSRLLGGEGRGQSAAGMASLGARGLRERPAELRWLLARLAREDASALARRMAGVLPTAEAVALLSGDHSQAAREASDSCRAPEEVAILLVLALGEGEIAWSPAAAEEALAEARRETFGVDLARLRTRPRSRRAELSVVAGEGDEIAAAPAGGGMVARLAGLIGEETGKLAGTELLAAVDAVARFEPGATRAMLRSFAAADAARLRRRLAGASPAELLKRMLPAHLAGPLVALAERIDAGEGEWDRLIEIAASVGDGMLAEALVAEAGRSLGRRSRSAAVRRELARLAVELAAPLERAAAARAGQGGSGPFGATLRQTLALGQLDLLLSERMPLPVPERAASVSRLIPDLVSVPPTVLRARLDAAGGGPSRTLLQAMSGADVYRLAALLVPRSERMALRRRLRESRSADRVALFRHLVGTGRLPPPVEAVPTAAALAPDLREKLSRLAASLSRRGLEALLAAFGAPPTLSGWDPAARLVLAVEQAAASLDLRPGPGWSLDRLLATVVGVSAGRGAAAETAISGLSASDLHLLDRALDPLALEGSVGPEPDSLVRRRLARRLLGVRRSAAAIAAPRLRDRGWAALVKARPLAVLELLARSEHPAEWAGELDALIGEAGAAVATFAGLPAAEREHSLALGRLLTGSRGRRAIAGAKVARALARAAATPGWRSGAVGFAETWIACLLEEASLAERADLRDLLSAIPAAAAGAAQTTSTRPPAPSPARPKARSAATPSPTFGAAKVDPLDEALRLIARPGLPARSAARRLAADAAVRSRLVAALGEARLLRLLRLLSPGGASGLLRAAEQVAAARQLAGHGLDRAALWRALLASAVSAPGDIAPLLRRLLGGDGILFMPSAARDRMELLLRETLDPRADAALLAALGPARGRRSADRSRQDKAVETLESGDSIKVDNAGLVLASAFLPRLFDSLGYMAPDASGLLAWRDAEVQARSVHLLQWLVDERSDAPEPMLALNKLLCGLDPALPIIASIEPTESELATCRGLLSAILGNWPPLASSSIAALRETFLQRDGRLSRLDAGWKLVVECQVIDILLDQLPWGFSTILHPWMPGSIAVQWR